MQFEHRYDRMWERLLMVLDALGEVDVGTPGRLRLSVEEREIEIVMTEQEWDELVSIPYGSFVSAANHLLHMVGRALMDRSPYLVYDHYELHACATAEKPVQAEQEADHRRVEEMLEATPGARVEWRAFPPDQDEPT